jgi:hypothetical protein
MSIAQRWCFGHYLVFEVLRVGGCQYDKQGKGAQQQQQDKLLPAVCSLLAAPWGPNSDGGNVVEQRPPSM